jgi:hypothetical protein
VEEGVVVHKTIRKVRKLAIRKPDEELKLS